jgi:hypothetical protein
MFPSNNWPDARAVLGVKPCGSAMRDFDNWLRAKPRQSQLFTTPDAKRKAELLHHQPVGRMKYDSSRRS